MLGADGTATVARMIHAAEGRCSGLHYGTYDYSAACGITAAYQSMDHAVADHTKAVMQVAAAGTGVRLSDGSTNLLPVGDGATVRRGWAEHLRPRWATAGRPPDVATTATTGCTSLWRHRGYSGCWNWTRRASSAMHRAVEVSGLSEDGRWVTMLARTPLLGDTRHRFPLPPGAPVTQLWMDVFPDGGIARVRAFGTLTTGGRAGLGLRWFDLLPAAAAEQGLGGSVGLPPLDASQLIGQRPFRSAGAVPDVLRPLLLGASGG